MASTFWCIQHSALILSALVVARVTLGQASTSPSSCIIALASRTSDSSNMGAENSKPASQIRDHVFTAYVVFRQSNGCCAVQQNNEQAMCSAD
jgi:hypothetical protein